MRHVHSALVLTLLMVLFLGLSACANTGANGPETNSGPDTGSTTPDGTTTPPHEEPEEEPECHPIEPALTCVDNTVFIYGNFGSGENGEDCYGEKKLMDCPFGCNFPEDTLTEIPFTDSECIDWDLCPIDDVCNAESEADST